MSQTDQHSTQSPPPPPPPPLLVPEPKPGFWTSRKKIIAGIVGGFLLLSVVASALGGADESDGSAQGKALIEEEPSTTAEPETPSTTVPPPTTEAPPEPAQPVTVPLGQPIGFETRGFVGESVEMNMTVSNLRTFVEPPGERYPLPARNGHYVVVDVVTEMTGGDGTYTSNPYNYSLVAADGTVYTTGILMADSLGPMLQVTDLAAGQRAAGWIAFDIPVNAEIGAKIQVDNVGMEYGEPMGYWQL